VVQKLREKKRNGWATPQDAFKLKLNVSSLKQDLPPLFRDLTGFTKVFTIFWPLPQQFNGE
jgi:hypothetical protein